MESSVSEIVSDGCSLDLLGDLNKAIDAYHDAFITDDTAQKRSQTWNCLQETARKYVLLVPHNRKFKFNETDRVLQESVQSLKDFSPKEASYAFECLVKYGHNLISQPWRQDFHVVKMTSGFFVHNISSHLINAEEILIAMGYVNISDESLKLVPNYELSTVKDVSRDCILACQECLILNSIWDTVSYQLPNYTFTLKRIYDFRCKNKQIEEICESILEEARSSQTNHGNKTLLSKTSKATRDLDLSLDSGSDFYEIVSPSDVMSKFSPAAGKSTFTNSVPKRAANQSLNKTASHSSTKEKSCPKGEYVLEESLSPRAASAVGHHHLYKNIPFLRNKDNNVSKSSLNREKTKWHTPIKAKLRPQEYLKHTKLSEDEIAILANASDSEDEDLGFNSIANPEREKSKSDNMKNDPEANRSVAVNFAQKNVFTAPNMISGVMQYAKDGNSSLFPKSSAEARSSSSTHGCRNKYFKDDAPVSKNSEKSFKSSYFPKSPNYDDEYPPLPDKQRARASSTVTSPTPWDKTIPLDESEPEEHCGKSSVSLAGNKNDTTVTNDSQSTYLPEESLDSSPYYENLEDSTNNKSVSSEHSAKTNDESVVQDLDDTSYFSCGNSSLKSPPAPVPAKTVNEPEKLEELEDVWFHALLENKDFNYLESQEEKNLSTLGYDDDGYDGDVSNVSKYAENARNSYNIPAAGTSGKFDDPVEKSNLHKRYTKTKPISKTSIESSDWKNREANNGNCTGKNSGSTLSFVPWNCKFCTFENILHEFICEMCCKSKVNGDEAGDGLPMEEDDVEVVSRDPYSLPDFMEVGDVTDKHNKPISSTSNEITCPQCTLYNVSTARVCAACDFPFLKSSSSPSSTSWLEDLTR